MKNEANTSKWLRIFITLIAIHSFCVGLSLMLLQSDWFALFGFAELNNRFFPVQGGVFHVVMAALYILSLRSKTCLAVLLPFIIGVKLFAFVFLISYYVFFEQLIVVLLSGIGDGFMGVILLVLYKRKKKS
ncbi:MAG: hypothetical protein K9H64_19375 [Bacteroidales bacterium]|nr:hypothetical protein [Bacteroidales bacterium]MCF8458247.1 hypothetical protein [Bacteroidales bacterium]